VVVLSHGTWTQQFASDPSLVGRAVRLGPRDLTVIGITPEGFTGIDIFLEPAYVPLAMAPALAPPGSPSLLDQRDIRTSRVLGRLAPGASIAQANEDVRVIGERLARSSPDTNQAQGLIVRSEMDTRTAALDPNVPLRSVRTVEDFYDASSRNFNAVMVRTVAGMARWGCCWRRRFVRSHGLRREPAYPRDRYPPSSHSPRSDKSERGGLPAGEGDGRDPSGSLRPV
jgi:hypothetical protein